MLWNKHQRDKHKQTEAQEGHCISFSFLFFNSSIKHLNKKFTVTRRYIFWCTWESTSKNLPKSQLDINIRYIFWSNLVSRDRILLSRDRVSNSFSMYAKFSKKLISYPLVRSLFFIKKRRFYTGKQIWAWDSKFHVNLVNLFLR